LGSKILELLEETAEEVMKMGQWSMGVHDTHYSIKLPLGAIQKLASYGSENKIYFNHLKIDFWANLSFRSIAQISGIPIWAI
jgi:hypothetical protein